MQKRASAVAAIVAWFGTTYFGVAAVLPEDAGRSLATPFDSGIPFVPSAVLVYTSVYVGALLPAFTVRSDELFSRSVWAYVGVIAICAVCFNLFPVSAASLRPDLPVLPDPDFIDWSVRLLYALDPPVNLFPSLHVALACCAAGASWISDHRTGILVWIWASIVGVATCLTKQHYVVDVIAGAALGTSAVWYTTRSVTSQALPAVEGESLHRLRWPFALYMMALGAFYIAYRVTGAQ